MEHLGRMTVGNIRCFLQKVLLPVLETAYQLDDQTNSWRIREIAGIRGKGRCYGALCPMGFDGTQMSLKSVAYSIFLAPKYSLQYSAVLSGGKCLQENTSMNALSVSSAKCPAMQDVSISCMRE